MAEIIVVIIEVIAEPLLMLLAELLSYGLPPPEKSEGAYSRFVIRACCFCAGFVFGCFTLVFFPDYFIVKPWAQVVNLVFAPLAVAYVVNRFTKERLAKGSAKAKHYGYIEAYIIALTFTLTRLVVTIPIMP